MFHVGVALLVGEDVGRGKHLYLTLSVTRLVQLVVQCTMTKGERRVKETRRQEIAPEIDGGKM